MAEKKTSPEKVLSGRKRGSSVSSSRELRGRTCLLVLGMHRSGTSAVTRVLSLLGAALPKNLMPPAAGNNEAGFWEPLRLAVLHDQMLAETGSAWDDWRRFNFDALPIERQAYYKTEISRLLEEEYGDAPLFVLKEPRICRFVPLYREIFRDSGVTLKPVLVFRNPYEIAASLAARDGITPTQSYLSWLRHVLDTEAATRDLPRATAFYRDLLSDWRRAIEPFARNLQLAWPNDMAGVADAVEGFLSLEHRHQFFSEPVPGASPDLSAWVSRLYVAAGGLGGNARAAVAEFDAIGREFDSAALLFGDLIAAMRIAHNGAAVDAARQGRELANERERHAIEIQELRRQAEATRIESEASTNHFKTQFEIGQKRVEETRKEMNDLASAKADAEIVAQTAKEELRDAQSEVEHLRTKLVAAKKAEESALAKQRAREGALLNAQRSAFLTSTSWKVTAPLRKIRSFVNIIQGYSVTVDPITELELISEEKNETSWNMIGNDPAFSLSFGASRLPAGHYRLVIDLRNGWMHLVRPCLYISVIEGQHPTILLPLQFRKGKEGQAVADFSLTKAAYHLRFDPSEHPGRLVIGRIKLQRLHGPFRVIALARRLRRDRIRTGADVWRVLEKAIRIIRADGVRGLAARVRQSYVDDEFPANRTRFLPRHANSGLVQGPTLAEVLGEEAATPASAIERSGNRRAPAAAPGAPNSDPLSPLKVLFVSYGSFNCNSGGHIAHFANELSRAGQKVCVCADGNEATAADFGEPLFKTAQIEEVRRQHGCLFDIDDGMIGDERTIIHAWTPRENVRTLVESLVKTRNCKYIVHLEDNEDYITSSAFGIEPSKFHQSPVSCFGSISGSLSHPVRYRRFLQNAAGATVIVDKLAEFVPSGLPIHLLEPGVESSLFETGIAPRRRSQLKSELNVSGNEILCLYCGNMHSANRREIFSLYVAMEILNRRGFPVRLIRTGNNYTEGLDESFSYLTKHVIELGYVARHRLIELMKLADFFVQPGSADMFNEYRLPSKIPEFLAAGKPMVLPAANIGLKLRNEKEAMILEQGDGKDIADKVERFLIDSNLGLKLSRNARRYAIRNHDWPRNTKELIGFYRKILSAT